VFGAWVIFGMLAVLVPVQQAASMEIVRILQYKQRSG
jgi:hypothetical protein